MADTTGYVICTAPRSGSTLLCRMLAATGVAGDPESLFHRPSLDDWAKRIGVARAPDASDAEFAREIFRAAIETGRGDTPVFAFRQQPHALRFLCDTLRELIPEAKTDAARLARVFGPLRYVHLMRDDKLAQAVSLVIAEQSGLWHRNADGSDYERLAPPKEPVFDPDAIAAAIEDFVIHDRKWNLWFAANDIEPYRLGYEDLIAAPEAELSRLLAWLDLDSSRAQGVQPPLARLADDVNRDWMDRYIAESRVDGRNER
ncbi:MAG: Stf0 family sulfotransferase [Pseudomonadota bacterium]